MPAPIVRTPMVDDDGSGTTGTIINNAWKTELYDQIDGGLVPPDWTLIPFNAANFTGSGAMTWTGIVQVTLQYLRNGNSVVVSFNLQNSTVGGTPDISLQIQLPPGLVAAKQVADTCRIRANNVGAVGYSIIVAGGTQLLCRKVDHGVWVASSGNNDVIGSIIIPVVAPTRMPWTPEPDDPGLVLPS